MNKNLLAAAAGNSPADLVVTNGKIVNVYSGEIYDGGVAISGGYIAAVGDVAYTIGPNTQIVDAKGRYITPGFIDGHVHPESSSLAIRTFAQTALAHGTTVIMSDLHEVGVVAGMEGIEATLEEVADTDLKVYFVVPSHIPFSPNLETSGGSLNPKQINQALQRPDAVGLSECVGPYILAQLPDLMESMDATTCMGKSIQGHLPDMEGPALNTCIAAGVFTDHESLGAEDAIARLRAGCHVMMREGSVARNMPDCLKGILEAKLDTSQVSIVTDDIHTLDLVNRGYLDDAVRTAIKTGANFVTAIQMVSLNAARAFHLDNQIGGLAPGRRADINLTTGPEDFKVETVIAGGKIVLKEGQLQVNYKTAQHKPCLLNTVTLKKPITADDFKTKAPQGASKVRVLAMDTLPFIPITLGREVELAVKDGIVQCDLEQDVVYISQVERYGKNGNIGNAFMGGFKLKEGAIASSVGHDNHNIVVLGTNFEDMAIAANRVAELGGGQAVVQNGNITAELAYPICGLLSDLPIEELAMEKDKLNQAIWKMGSEIPLPFMFLSFICLAAIPHYAITDHGFIDVLEQKVINPVLEGIQ